MAQGPPDPDKPPQGWFVDPFRTHEARWFSQGTPTALVRDGRAESQDPPPELPITGTLVPAGAAPGPASPAPGPIDLRGRRLGGGDGRPTGDAADGDAHRDAPDRELDSAGEVIAGRAVPTSPPRILRTRWVALGGAVVWMFLIAVQFLGSDTQVSTGVSGHERTETIYVADPAAALFLVFLLALACLITGVGLVRRVRSHSEGWSRWGCVSAGCIGVLGIVSLASVGLGLVILAALLLVVARPIRRGRPIPGDRMVGPLSVNPLRRRRRAKE